MKLKNIQNFRDLGEIKTKSKTKLQKGKIYRSGLLDKANPKELDYLFNILNIKYVIDLRNTGERERNPEITYPEVNFINIPIINIHIDKVHPEVAKELKIGVAFEMEEFYDAISKDPYTKEQSEKVLEFIINHDFSKGNILFHCTKGKDRTGIIAAKVLEYYNYTTQEIISDFLYSNKTYFFHSLFIGNKVYLKTKSHDIAKEYMNFFKLKSTYITKFLKKKD